MSHTRILTAVVEGKRGYLNMGGHGDDAIARRMIVNTDSCQASSSEAKLYSQR